MGGQEAVADRAQPVTQRSERAHIARWMSVHRVVALRLTAPSFVREVRAASRLPQRSVTFRAPSATHRDGDRTTAM
jgi:hypothetical protein